MGEKQANGRDAIAQFARKLRDTDHTGTMTRERSERIARNAALRKEGGENAKRPVWVRPDST
jgi:hypothetical protein